MDTRTRVTSLALATALLVGLSGCLPASEAGAIAACSSEAVLGKHRDDAKIPNEVSVADVASVGGSVSSGRVEIEGLTVLEFDSGAPLEYEWTCVARFGDGSWRATISSFEPAGGAAAPAPTPTPTLREWGVNCRILDDSFATVEERRFNSLEASWASGRPWSACDAFVVSGDTYSDLERAATATAGYDTVDSVDTLYGLCAEVGGFYVTDGIVSEAQAEEVAGMLTLCPDFPAAAQLEAASAAARQIAAERAAGLRFFGGVYEVGVTVQPGRYQTTGPVENCYWERLDAAGEIIDNNFVSAATQVQVTIAPTDFAIHVDGCGEFVKIG